ncbi:hypothetical protein [Sphingomonas jaspsi]|uniref:hypothetical protein n=1 Tax=Sphingomonas jaspsi TaxID=392409 RepID=UPI0004AD29CE|nr:hypothetical protein [Sphingomonas jaspsi]
MPNSQIKLETYSPWNGYPTMADALDGGSALYELSRHDFDRSSYGTIADHMDVAQTTARMIGVDPVHFVINHMGKRIDMGGKLDLADALKQIGISL